MPNAKRGEVWMVDLGMAAKARPAVVVSIRFQDNERALYAVIPHTTATRGGRFEVVINVPWLKPGLLMFKASAIFRVLFLCGALAL